MIAVCAIGVSQYNNASLDTISCAGDDAKAVYMAFRKLLGADFGELRSICLEEICVADFVSILKTYKRVLSDRDTLILYFSGHAKIDPSAGGTPFTLELLFHEYSGDEEGQYSLNSIAEIFKKSDFDILLILDCCQAGGATTFASSVAALGQHSVLASCGVYDTSEYHDSGSAFTRSLCRVLAQLTEEGGEVSLSKISTLIKDSGYNKHVTHIGTSTTGDLVLKKERVYNYSELPNRFLYQLDKADGVLREALWYALADVPSKIVLKILSSYFRCTNVDTHFPSEASWLVRRAIGSLIAQFSTMDDIRKQLIQSMVWEEQCIGIIASRYLFKQNDVYFKLVIDQINQESISMADPIWLANLYLSENPEYDYSFFVKTRLGRTHWGLTEIYERLDHNRISDSEYICALETMGINDKIVHNVKKYIDFKTKEPDSSNKLFGLLWKQTHRGPLPTDTRLKFLLSALYGTWRGHINLDLRTYMGNTAKRKIRKELASAKIIPIVSWKIAIFDFFRSNPEYLRDFASELLWGLEDEHPRVCTAAVKAFAAINHSAEDLYKAVRAHCDNFDLPGIFDLFLECPVEYRDTFLEYLKSIDGYGLADLDSLKWAWL